MRTFPSNLIIFLFLFTCWAESFAQNQDTPVVVGAERMIFVIPTVKNKHIAIVANQTSMVGNSHLVDTLLKLGASIKVIFCPEHGFRGTEDAGERIRSSKDLKTGIPIVSLYGKKFKPSANDLVGVDIVLYDLQDVGVRYYTYISTLFYVMQACAENFVPLFILDRPDPNGFYVDGPVLEPKYKSFVGMFPIPIVYGMTPGELATMANEEGWLPNGEKCALGVIPCMHYSHKVRYILPIHPSPNLRNMNAVYLYPSLGWFEGTIINVGRGTDFPFQVFGSPEFKDTSFQYQINNENPNLHHKGQISFGVDLRDISLEYLSNSKQLEINYLLTAYNLYPEKEKFFVPFFENLVGNGKLRKQIMSGISEEEIRKSWEPALSNFKLIRKKYLLYEDFDYNLSK